MEIRLFRLVILWAIFYKLCDCTEVSKLVESVCQTLTSNETNVMEISCDDSSTVRSMLKNINVAVHFNQNEPVCSKKRHQIKLESGLYILSTHNILTSIADLMIYWRRFIGTIIFDQHSGFQLKETFNYLQKLSIIALLLPISEDSDLSNEIIKSTTYQNIIVVCHPQLLDMIINEIKRLDLFVKNFTWLFVSEKLPEPIFGVDIPPNSQVTLISPNFSQSLVDSNDEQNYTVTKTEIVNRETINSLCSTQEESLKREIKLHLQQVDQNAAYLKLVRTAAIYDVFYSPTTSRTESIKFAEWNVMKKNRLTMVETFDVNDKLRLRERRVRVVVFEHLPYSAFTYVNRTFRVDGYLKDMIETLLINYNLRYSLRKIDAIFGIGINGTYTGMVGVFYKRVIF